MQDSKLNGVTVLSPGKSDIPGDVTGENALLSRIPLQSRNSRKAEYLGYRSMGFTVTESCDLTNITLKTLYHWRDVDSEFTDFETNKLKELQETVSRDLIRLDFLRNMRLALYRDFKVLWKAAFDLHSLSPSEFDYLKIIRKLYTPQDMATLDRALIPEDDGANRSTTINAVIVNVDGRAVEEEAAYRAAAKDLLNKFTVNRALVESSPDGDGNHSQDGEGGDHQ